MGFVGYAISFGALILIGILYAYAHSIAEEKLRRNIGKRTIIPFEEWFVKNYGHADKVPADLVKDVLTIIADEMGVDATQIKPDDRFNHELAVQGKYRHLLLDDNVSTALEKIAKKYPFGGKSPKLETIDDLIRFLAKGKSS